MRDDDDDFDRPRMRDADDDRYGRPHRPRKTGGSWKGVLFLLGVAGVVALGCCGVGGYFLYDVIAKPVAFAAADWKDFSFPDGSCSCQFPVPPTLDPTPSNAPGVTVTNYIYQVPAPRDAAMAFGYVDPILLAPGMLDTFATETSREVAAEVKGKVVRTTDLTVEGCPAKEFEVQAGNATLVCRIVQLTNRTAPRFVILVAGGRNLSKADRDKFLTSFKVKKKA